MCEPPALAALVADPARAAEVPVDHVPALLDAVCAEVARLDTIKSILAARLATGRPNAHGKPEPPYTLHEAATLVVKSAPWLRRLAKANGVLGARKAGKSWTFDRGTFDRWRQRPQIG